MDLHNTVNWLALKHFGSKLIMFFITCITIIHSFDNVFHVDFKFRHTPFKIMDDVAPSSQCPTYKARMIRRKTQN